LKGFWRWQFSFWIFFLGPSALALNQKQLVILGVPPSPPPIPQESGRGWGKGGSPDYFISCYYWACRHFPRFMHPLPLPHHVLYCCLFSGVPFPFGQISKSQASCRLLLYLVLPLCSVDILLFNPCSHLYFTASTPQF
jgi:hypothetical protein